MQTSAGNFFCHNLIKIEAKPLIIGEYPMPRNLASFSCVQSCRKSNREDDIACLKL